MSEWEEQIEQQRINDKERLERLEKSIERIKEDLQTIINQPIEKIDRSDLEDIIEEIEWEIRCLEWKNI